MQPTNHEPSSLRVHGPDDVLAAVPVLLGFHPERSLVGLALDGPAARVVMTARVDLAMPADPAAALIRAFERVGPDSVVIVAYDDVRFGCGEHVLRKAASHAGSHGWGVGLVLMVAGGRWWRIDNEGVPQDPDGRPVTVDASALLAEAVYRGAVVHGRREDLLAALACRVDPSAAAEAASRAEGDLAHATTRVALLERAEAAVVGHHVGDSLESAAIVASALQLGEFRDRCYQLMLNDPPRRWVSTWCAVLQQVATYLRPGPAAMVAMSSYLAGNGALANLAVDEALSGDGGHPTALLVRDLIEDVIPPDSVWEMLRDLA